MSDITYNIYKLIYVANLMVTKQNMGPTVWMLCRRSGLSPPPNTGPGSDSQYYQTRAEPPNRLRSGSSQTSRRRHGGSVHNISLHSWWFDFMKIFNRRDFFFSRLLTRKLNQWKCDRLGHRIKAAVLVSFQGSLIIQPGVPTTRSAAAGA